jgi:hypothetical protein
VRNALDAGIIHYEGKREGVVPWKSKLFWALLDRDPGYEIEKNPDPRTGIYIPDQREGRTRMRNKTKRETLVVKYNR